MLIQEPPSESEGLKNRSLEPVIKIQNGVERVHARPVAISPNIETPRDHGLLTGRQCNGINLMASVSSEICGITNRSNSGSAWTMARTARSWRDNGRAGEGVETESQASGESVGDIKTSEI